MKTAFFLLFFIGWTMIVIGYVQSYKQCPPNEVEYRYIPRRLLDDQLSADNKFGSLNWDIEDKSKSDVSSIFDSMTSYRDPLA